MSQPQTKPPSWYSTGYEGVEKEKARKEAAQKPRRFWIPPGITNQLVFIDDDPFNIYEFNWQHNGSWMNWATMPEDADANDVFREKGYTPYFTGIFTVINCTPWEDKQGKKYNFGIQFLAAKEKTVELIRDRKLTRGGLAGKMFKVKRFEGQKTASAGDDYDFEKEVDMEKILPYANYQNEKFIDLINQANEDPARMVSLKNKFQLSIVDGKALPQLVPFNYMELLRPPTVREARNLMAGVARRNSGRDGASAESSSEDNMPF